MFWHHSVMDDDECRNTRVFKAEKLEDVLHVLKDFTYCICSAAVLM
jgi:hypothetical protein